LRIVKQGKQKRRQGVKKKYIYTWGAEAIIEAALPQALRDAMRKTGWNAFGIYELVKETINKEKKTERGEAHGKRENIY
jgi:hypothetical protein